MIDAWVLSFLNADASGRTYLIIKTKLRVWTTCPIIGPWSFTILVLQRSLTPIDLWHVWQYFPWSTSSQRFRILVLHPQLIAFAGHFGQCYVLDSLNKEGVLRWLQKEAKYHVDHRQGRVTISIEGLHLRRRRFNSIQFIFYNFLFLICQNAIVCVVYSSWQSVQYLLINLKMLLGENCLLIIGKLFLLYTLSILF